MKQKTTIYEDFQAAQDEQFLDEEKTDGEQEAVLAKLEVAWARVKITTYDIWPRAKRYAFDRRNTLLSSLSVRRYIGLTETAGWEDLTDSELFEVRKNLEKMLKAHQNELVKIRIERCQDFDVHWT